MIVCLLYRNSKSRPKDKRPYNQPLVLVRGDGWGRDIGHLHWFIELKGVAVNVSHIYLEATLFVFVIRFGSSIIMLKNGGIGSQPLDLQSVIVRYVSRDFDHVIMIIIMNNMYAPCSIM